MMAISCKQESEKATAIENEEVTTASTSESESSKKILFFGDSITAGYGLEDSNDAYPGVLQQKIDSLELNYSVINSGVSGETTAGGKSRIDWILNQDIDVFILELGANDGLRGVALDQTRSNLQDIITAVQEKDPSIQIILAGMQLPPNMGQAYTEGFRKIFSDLATINNIALIPFILEDVGGVPALNQSDGIHPTVEGHQIVARNVWEILEPIIRP